MKKTGIVIMLAASLTSCHKLDIAKGTPECIVEMIKNGGYYSCGDAYVEEYVFQGKTVYVFIEGSRIMDAGSSVIDAQCNSIGYLGGITGNMTINGEPFSNAKFVRVIWKKQ